MSTAGRRGDPPDRKRQPVVPVLILAGVGAAAAYLFRRWSLKCKKIKDQDAGNGPISGEDSTVDPTGDSVADVNEIVDLSLMAPRVRQLNITSEAIDSCESSNSATQFDAAISVSSPAVDEQPELEEILEEVMEKSLMAAAGEMLFKPTPEILALIIKRAPPPMMSRNLSFFGVKMSVENAALVQALCLPFSLEEVEKKIKSVFFKRERLRRSLQPALQAAAASSKALMAMPMPRTSSKALMAMSMPRTSSKALMAMPMPRTSSQALMAMPMPRTSSKAIMGQATVPLSVPPAALNGVSSGAVTSKVAGLFHGNLRARSLNRQDACVIRSAGLLPNTPEENQKMPSSLCLARMPMSLLPPPLAEKKTEDSETDAIGTGILVLIPPQLPFMLHLENIPSEENLRCRREEGLTLTSEQVTKRLNIFRPNKLQEKEGVLEAIKISCQEYPTRCTFDEFIDRFGVLAPEVLGRSCDGVTASKKILDKVQLPDYQIGITTVFLRAGQMAELDVMRNEVLGRAASNIQRNVRAHQGRKSFILVRSSAIYLQSVCRGTNGRALYKSTRRENASLIIQTYFRRHHAVKTYEDKCYSFIILQSAFRGMAARKELLFRRKTNAAIFIQAIDSCEIISATSNPSTNTEPSQMGQSGAFMKFTAESAQESSGPLTDLEKVKENLRKVAGLLRKWNGNYNLGGNYKPSSSSVTDEQPKLDDLLDEDLLDLVTPSPPLPPAPLLDEDLLDSVTPSPPLPAASLRPLLAALPRAIPLVGRCATQLVKTDLFNQTIECLARERAPAPPPTQTPLPVLASPTSCSGPGTCTSSCHGASPCSSPNHDRKFGFHDFQSRRKSASSKP